MIAGIRGVHCYLFVVIMAMTCLAGCNGGSRASGDTVETKTTILQSSTWQPSHPLSLEEHAMPMVTAAISNDIASVGPGHALAVWNQYEGSKFRIVASEYRTSSGWGSPVVISKREVNCFRPRIKSDSKGNAIILWQTDKYDLGVALFSNSTGWQDEYYLPYNCAGFDVATLPDGFLLAISRWDGQHFTVSSLRLSPGSGWSALEVLQSSTSFDAFEVNVATGSKGDAVAVWEQYDREISENGAIKYIWASRYDPAAGWKAAQRVGDQSAGNASTPKAAVDAQGNALVVWAQIDGPAYLPATARSNIWSNQYTAGVGWSGEKLLSTNNYGNAYMPTVASASTGKAVAVWRQSSALRYGVANLWFSSFSIDKGWEAAGNVSEAISWDGDDGYQGRITAAPGLIVDDLGNALVVWDFDNFNSSNNIASCRYVAGAGWKSPELIDSPSSGYGYAPKLALDVNGTAIAVWCNAKGLVDSPVVSVWGSLLK